MQRPSNDTRGYRISRKPDQLDDSLDSFEWQPPKESDELYEALKSVFPKGTTHRYRMRDALIDFLLQEREEERESQKITTTTIKPIAELNDATTWVKSTSDSEPQVALSGNEVSSNIPNGQLSLPRKKKPKDWDSMTVVWTSENGLAKEPRSKRTMTEEEKKEYQLRRVRGACVSCKKKKRKCNHDSPRPQNCIKNDSSPPFDALPRPDMTRLLDSPARNMQQTSSKDYGIPEKPIPQYHEDEHQRLTDTMLAGMATNVVHTRPAFIEDCDMLPLSTDSWNSPGPYSISLLDSSQSPPSSVSISSPVNGNSIPMYGANLMDSNIDSMIMANPLSPGGNDTPKWWHDFLGIEYCSGAIQPNTKGALDGHGSPQQVASKSQLQDSGKIIFSEIEKPISPARSPTINRRHTLRTSTPKISSPKDKARPTQLADHGFEDDGSPAGFELPIGGSISPDWWDDAISMSEVVASGTADGVAQRQFNLDDLSDLPEIEALEHFDLALEHLDFGLESMPPPDDTSAFSHQEPFGEDGSMARMSSVASPVVLSTNTIPETLEPLPPRTRSHARSDSFSDKISDKRSSLRCRGRPRKHKKMDSIELKRTPEVAPKSIIPQPIPTTDTSNHTTSYLKYAPYSRPSKPSKPLEEVEDKILSSLSRMTLD